MFWAVVGRGKPLIGSACGLTHLPLSTRSLDAPTTTLVLPWSEKGTLVVEKGNYGNDIKHCSIKKNNVYLKEMSQTGRLTQQTEPPPSNSCLYCFRCWVKRLLQPIRCCDHLPQICLKRRRWFIVCVGGGEGGAPEKRHEALSRSWVSQGFTWMSSTSQ